MTWLVLSSIEVLVYELMWLIFMCCQLDIIDVEVYINIYFNASLWFLVLTGSMHFICFLLYIFIMTLNWCKLALMRYLT